MHPKLISTKARHTCAFAALFVLFLLPPEAAAQDLSLKLEPGVALPLSTPQSEIYGMGGGQMVKALYGLTPYLDIGPAVSFTILSPGPDRAESGVSWGLGGGLRLKRPHDADTYGKVSPWIDADLLYARTGDIGRPAFDIAVGASMPLGKDRVFWFGPFVRYLQVIQTETDGFDNSDARILNAGLSFEFGSGVSRVRDESEPPPPLEAEVRTTTTTACPDSDADADGVTDSHDRCPQKAGVVENWGCPNYEKLIIKPDKLELKEKLYFALNEATLEEASYPVLDEVAQALNDNTGFRVQIEGHADSSGSEVHNQALSEQRAKTVLDYLASRGVAPERMVSKGFSSSVPRESNETAEGRENNRRVEFVVYFVIVNPESAN